MLNIIKRIKKNKGNSRYPYVSTDLSTLFFKHLAKRNCINQTDAIEHLLALCEAKYSIQLVIPYNYLLLITQATFSLLCTWCALWHPILDSNDCNRIFHKITLFQLYFNTFLSFFCMIMLYIANNTTVDVFSFSIRYYKRENYSYTKRTEIA